MRLERASEREREIGSLVSEIEKRGEKPRVRERAVVEVGGGASGTGGA